MIPLHNIKGKPKIDLNDWLMINLGDALIGGYEPRIWIGVRGGNRIETNPWGRGWKQYIAHRWWNMAEREKATRRRRAVLAMQEPDSIPIFFTAAARRERGIA